MRCVHLILFIVLFGGGLVAQAQINPAWRYRVLRSPHFELIYRDNQKDLAKLYLIAAERAHELLFPIFKEAPYKTIVVLKDDTDNSNGMATFLPYPHILIYPVLPTTLDSVDEYGDWALEIMVHEYTHILNMYPAHGIYAPLKWVFGSVIRPNALLPRWYLEGLAVNTESTLSTHGRLRSTDTQGALRALVLGKKLSLEDIARINEAEVDSWPYGARPYLFGGWWWQGVQNEKGTEVIHTWNQNFSRRLPYFLNGPLLEQTGKSAQEILNHTTKLLEDDSQKQIQMLRSSQPHLSRAIAEDNGEQQVFALSPSGKRLVYWLHRSRREGGSQARLKERQNPNENWSDVPSRRLFKSVGTLKVRWLNDDSFVFDQAALSRPYGMFRDLHLYDFKDGITRLTDGERAQEPSPSPSGDRIAFIQNDGGRNRLAVLDRGTKAIQVLVKGSFNLRLSSPEFLDENRILFAARKKSGQERLHVFDLKTKRTQVWNQELTGAQNPRLTAKGLLVTDNRTHVRNVYLINDGRIAAKTNTLTDIQTVDYDNQRGELIISELTPDGRRLRALPWADFQPPQLPASALPPPPEVKTQRVSFQEESYQPIAYLWPRYLLPFIYQVEDGFIFQGLTSNQDPIGRNQYSLMASYDTVTNEPSYGFNFVNHSLPTSIGVGYSKSVSYLGASALTLQSQDAVLSLSQFWPVNHRDFRWSLNGLWSDTQGVLGDYRRMGGEIAGQYARLNHPLNETWGVHIEFSHQEFIEQENYLGYGRSYLGAAINLELGGNHRVFLQTRASLAPELPFGAVLDLGERSLGGNYLVNLANSQFLLRGYPSGTFVGRKVVNANLEYIFPAVSVDRGFGTFPLFMRNLELALFADTMAVDGAGYQPSARIYRRSGLSDYFSGVGAEVRLDTTTGYHLPLAVTAGLYYGLNDRYGGGFTPFLGIGFGGLSPIEKNKTP